MTHQYSIDAQVYTHNGKNFSNGVIVGRHIELNTEPVGIDKLWYTIRPNYAGVKDTWFDFRITEEELEENFYIGEVEYLEGLSSPAPYEEFGTTYYRHKHISCNTQDALMEKEVVERELKIIRRWEFLAVLSLGIATGVVAMQLLT